MHEQPSASHRRTVQLDREKKSCVGTQPERRIGNSSAKGTGPSPDSFGDNVAARRKRWLHAKLLTLRAPMPTRSQASLVDELYGRATLFTYGPVYLV
jgi:hypothetical protein